MNKLKNSNWKLKLFICVVITIIGLICMKLTLNDWKYKEESYDYSLIYSVNGVITNAYFRDTDSSSYYIDIKLETGETITIELSGGELSYSEGENIIIYTDGIHYFTTQKGVANEAQHTIINFFLCCIISFFIIAIWTFLFGWKGFLIGLFVVIFFCIN